MPKPQQPSFASKYVLQPNCNELHFILFECSGIRTPSTRMFSTICTVLRGLRRYILNFLNQMHSYKTCVKRMDLDVLEHINVFGKSGSRKN